jgi:uncharacterized protein (DUF2236 family)
MLDLSFGDEALRQRTAARINAIHERVHGRLPEAVGRYAAGAPYDATEPDLLRWVHATLLESMPLAYERFVGPLSPPDWDDFCAESEEAGLRLGMPRAMLFRRASEVKEFLEDGIGNGTVAVGPQARAVARQLLYPPLTDPTRPAAWLNRLVTLGLLPPPVRDAYGFPWSAGRDRSLRVVTGAIRRLVKALPPAARYWRASRFRQ